ncbi:type VI secretion system baseplate subunit TssK [Lacibacterium aquatile]|uniref:Type VI secretion system baseplate subunit TssK n=1 Tax=Lacibacterium aquatile TaxID=1168082 RepID=A0ABW5DYF1_9PROT
MTVAREPVPALLWHEGMMLSPQHFQQLVLRQEQVTLYHAAASTPFHWGLSSISFDRVALGAGNARVLELEAILPDGLIVKHIAERDLDTPLRLDLTPYAEAASRAPLTLYLAVPIGRSADGAGGELPRYETYEGAPLIDEAGGGEEISVQRLRPRCTLVVTTTAGQRPPAKYAALPIARITYENETFALSQTYVPPSLMVGERSTLGVLVADIARRAREKALYLAGRIAAAEAGGQPVTVETRAEIQGLAAGLPALEAMIGIGRAHPFTLYIELTRFAGLLSAFAAASVAPLFSRYDHDDPYPAFAEVRDVIMRTLDRVRESARPVPFLPEGQKFTLALEPAWTKSDRLLIGVRGPVNMAEAEIAAWVEASLIATRDKSQNLWDLRVSGAPRKPLDRGADLDFAPPRGTVLFDIAIKEDSITPGEVLEIWNPDTRGGRMRPTDVVLYVAT